MDSKKVYLSRIFLELYIPPWLLKSFKIYGVKITGKYICESKNWIWLLMHPKQSSPLGFITTIPGRRKLFIFSKQSVLKIYFFPANSGKTMKHFSHHVLYSLFLYLFPILKSSILLLYETNKFLWFRVWPFRQNYIVGNTMCFKVIQNVC